MLNTNTRDGLKLALGTRGINNIIKSLIIRTGISDYSILIIILLGSIMNKILDSIIVKA